MTALLARCKSLLLSPVRLFCNADDDAAQAITCSTLMNFQTTGDDDGWYPVATIGEHPHERGLQVCTAEDAETLVNWAAEQPETWTGVPIYANPPHPSRKDDPPALAWAREFRVLGNEVQCRPEFSESGRELVLANKAYKRVTVAWGCRRKADGWHPFRISHIGLTNKPNMKGVRPWVNGPDGDGENAGDEEDAVTIEELIANGGDWWDTFVGKLTKLIKDADTADDARRVLSERLEKLWDQSRTLESMQSLIAQLANSAGVAKDADGETLAKAVDEACNRAARLERELADAQKQVNEERRFANEALADKYIALRRVDPKKRDNAIALLENNREDTLAVWSADTAPAGTPPPADPLAGRVLKNAGLGTVERASDEDLAKIVAKARELQNSEGLGAGEANDRAWAMFANGTLN